MKTKKETYKNIYYGGICPNTYWQQFSNNKNYK